jgi:hypothetical protein
MNILLLISFINLYHKCSPYLLQEEDKKLYSVSPVDSDDDCRDDFSDVKIDVKDFENQEARLGFIFLCLVWFTVVELVQNINCCSVLWKSW